MSGHNRSAFGWLVCIVPALCQAQTYTISTVAGGANPYYYAGTGDGGPATKAGLANPVYDVAADNSGNLYIAAGTLIRKVNPTNGNISTYAGGGSDLGEGIPATSAALSPTALAVDTTGNLYIADTAYGFYRIRKVDTSGNITTVAGGAQCCALGDGGPATSAYLSIPYGVAVDAAGNLYIAQSDGQNNLVRKVTASNGVISTIAGGGTGSGDGGQATTISLSRPTGVAVDSQGNVYIAEANGNRIRMVSGAGVITTIAGSGAGTTTGDGGPATGAGVNSPWHVAIDSGGNIYITETNDARVRLVANGNITTLAGNGTQSSTGDMGPAASATLDHPAGIAVGGAGIYIAQKSPGIATVRLVTVPVTVTITKGGVVPVYSSVNTIQAGSWVSIYGTGLAASPTIWKGEFPTSLGNTSVTIDGKPAYLWFVSPTQINLQPADDLNTGQVTVVVTTSAGTASSTVTLAPYAPSLSLFNSKYPAAIAPTPGSPGNSGSGYDYIGPTGAFAFPTRPAKAGETLLLFGVGFGPTNPAVPAGRLYSGAATSVTMPQIGIGGIPAVVAFAGITEAGLFQFNVTVPRGAGTGDQVLAASVNGISAQSNIFITLQ